MPRIVIAGGGIAGLEALIALHGRLGSPAHEIELLEASTDLVERQRAVAEPFGGEPRAALRSRAYRRRPGAHLRPDRLAVGRSGAPPRPHRPRGRSSRSPTPTIATSSRPRHAKRASCRAAVPAARRDRGGERARRHRPADAGYLPERCGFLPLAPRPEQAPRTSPGDLEVLARGHDERAHRRARSPDLGVGRGRALASGRARRPRKPSPPPPAPDRRRVLAHAAGEHERVEPAERRRHRRDRRRAAGGRRRRGRGRASASPRRRASTSRMSPCPPGPAGRRLALQRRRATSLGVEPACSQQPQHAGRGRRVPERVAITSPSSGVKPIVVSTERPPRTAASEAPAPRWQVTTPAAAPAGAGAARRRRATGRGSRTGAAPSARATRGAARRWRPPPGGGVERGVEAGDRRHVGQRARRPRRCRPAPPAGAAAPASVELLAGPPTTSSSTRTGSRKRAPPCTTRCPTASGRRSSGAERPSATSLAGRAGRAAPSSSSSSSSTRSLRLLDPALTTRTRIRRQSPGQRPVADLRRVVAVLAGVGAVRAAARRPSAGAARGRARPEARARGR